VTGEGVPAAGEVVGHEVPEVELAVHLGEMHGVVMVGAWMG
jgi:hypothetical protein